MVGQRLVERKERLAGHSSIRRTYPDSATKQKKHCVWTVGPRTRLHVRSRDSRMVLENLGDGEEEKRASASEPNKSW